MYNIAYRVDQMNLNKARMAYIKVEEDDDYILSQLKAEFEHEKREMTALKGRRKDMENLALEMTTDQK
jgi:hypothetical protein